MWSKCTSDVGHTVWNLLCVFFFPPLLGMLSFLKNVGIFPREGEGFTPYRPYFDCMAQFRRPGEKIHFPNVGKAGGGQSSGCPFWPRFLCNAYHMFANAMNNSTIWYWPDGTTREFTQKDSITQFLFDV